jgi:hypothetical protein
MRDEGYMPLFDLGRIVATPAALEVAGHYASEFISRHVRGSWEESPEEDRLANHRAVLSGDARILSVHRTELGQIVWIITEADRAITTLLLPSEY